MPFLGLFFYLKTGLSSPGWLPIQCNWAWPWSSCLNVPCSTRTFFLRQASCIPFWSLTHYVVRPWGLMRKTLDFWFFCLHIHNLFKAVLPWLLIPNTKRSQTVWFHIDIYRLVMLGCMCHIINLSDAWDGTQGFVHARQMFCQWSYTPSQRFKKQFFSCQLSNPNYYPNINFATIW